LSPGFDAFGKLPGAGQTAQMAQAGQAGAILPRPGDSVFDFARVRLQQCRRNADMRNGRR